MTNRFHLLRLPQDVLKKVLRSMEPLQLVMLSFSSNRAKLLVASVNLKCKITVIVSNQFRISTSVGEHIFHWVFYYHEVTNGAVPVKIGPPGIMYLTHYFNGFNNGRVYGVPKVMDVPSWIKHNKTIFNCSNSIFQLQFFQDVGNFDLESVKDNIGEFHILKLFTRNSDAYNQRIMKTFPAVLHLSLETETYDNGKPPGAVLIQNLSRFFIGKHSENRTTMQLDDILMMSSKIVQIYFSQFTEKDANRFLKLWMRGKSKLIYLFLCFANEMNVDKNIVLKGIKFKEIPIEEKKFFPGVINPIEGGIDVVRKDGTNGTIRFGNGHMDFFVWNDYCKMVKT